MSNLFDQIVSQRGSLEQLIARIPGFRGYVNKGDRRQADQMLRDYLVKQVDQRIQRMIQAEQALLGSGGLRKMSKTQAVRTKIQRYRDRISAAMPGYSGFGAALKVEEEDLARIYSFDEAQIRYVDRLSETIQGFSDAVSRSAGIDEALRAVEVVADEANEAFSLRQDLLADLDRRLGGSLT